MSVRNCLREIINESIGELHSKIEKELGNVKEAKDFLKKIKFNDLFKVHPLLGKSIDFGNLARNIKKFEPYKKLEEKLKEVSERKIRPEDINEIRKLIEDLAEDAIDWLIRQWSDTKAGLRPIHAPGSVSRDEARNLYFGEKYTKEMLEDLAKKLCRSIALGNNVGIYSEDEEFMRELKQLIPGFSSIRLDPKELGISKYEARHPYATLLSFILWLSSRDSSDSILNILKTSPLVLFFVPSREEREKWKTIGLPRLDFFVNYWILNDKNREKLEDLRKLIKDFINNARTGAKRKGETKKAENMIELVMKYYESICQKLLEHGNLDLYSVRRIIEIATEAIAIWDLKINLKPLGSIALNST